MNSELLILGNQGKNCYMLFDCIQANPPVMADMKLRDGPSCGGGGWGLVWASKTKTLTAKNPAT